MLAAAASCLGIQDFFYRKIFKLIQNDPYAYFLKHKIAEVLNISMNDLETKCTPSRLQEIMKYGFPGTDCLILYSDYVLSLDRRNRVPHWTFEHLRAECVAPTDPNDWHTKPRGASRRSAEFQADMRVPSLFRVDVTDYWNSGYDRGHLAASGNHQCQQINCNETFYMTNITPQVGRGFNRDAWNNLEIYVRELTERYGSVFVCTGPLYLPKRNHSGNLNVEYKLIGTHGVAVPTHFFKVVIVESKLPRGMPYMEAYVMPNTFIPDETDLRTFLTDLREIERTSGLKFFEGIRHSDFFACNYSTKLQIFENFN